MKKYILIIFYLLIQLNPLKSQPTNEFSFIFMTDIHLQPERGAVQAFKKAIDTANTINADFVMTGGDLVYDVLRGNYNRSESLFNLYKSTIKELKIPIYHCIGNHELFGIYPESNIDSLHPDYKYGMFERHLGDTYYSFDHKGWHFIVLNSIDERDHRYIGIINDPQMDWLKNDLAQIDKNTPISVTLHIPLVCTYNQVYPKGEINELPNELWVYNRKEVLNLFREYNLKLVLQGHMHWLEDLNIQDKTRFITGGSIAGRPSWRRKDNRDDGIYYNEEGFLVFEINGQEISWKYIDIGWEAIE